AESLGPGGVAEKAAKRRQKFAELPPSRRLFVGSLPLAVDVGTVREALGSGAEMVHWITDKTSGVWYGSTFVQMASKSDAKRVVKEASEGTGIRIGKRKLRVSFAPPAEGDEWPPSDFNQLDRPPLLVDLPQKK
ncbi:unnamed protein product, partial [Polarella glacialis]